MYIYQYIYGLRLGLRVSDVGVGQRAPLLLLVIVDYVRPPFIGNTPLLGPYSRTMHRALWWVLGGGSLHYERSTAVSGMLCNLSIS